MILQWLLSIFQKLVQVEAYLHNNKLKWFRWCINHVASIFLQQKKGLLISTQWILMSKVLPKFVSGRLRGVNSVVRVWPCHFKGRTSNLVGDSCKVTIGYTLTDNNFPLPRFRKKKSASSPRFLCHASKFKINGRGEITKNASIQSILHDINTIWL